MSLATATSHTLPPYARGAPHAPGDKELTMHKMTHTIYGLTTPVPAHIHGDKALQANVAAIVFLLVLLLALAPIYTAHA